MASQHDSTSPISPAPQTSSNSPPLDMQYYLTAGLEGVKRQQYRSIRSFSKAIDSRHDEFDSDSCSAGQHLVFVSVAQKHLADIHRLRERRLKGLCSMYLKREEVLVIKIIPSAVQEMVHLGFGSRLHMKVYEMGLRWDLIPIGHTTFEGIIGKKEADSTFIPSVRRIATDWPTVVFNCGMSESLERLRVDSRWWLENSTEVKIVLLFAISKANKGLHLEQWEMLTAPNSGITGAQPDPLTMVVTKTHEIDIVAGVATGAPLIFDFQKVFLRPPVLGEGDIIFSAQELGEFATHIWAGAQ